MTDPAPVADQDLVLDDEGRATHDGALFSGLSVRCEDDGTRLSEDTWREGVRHGPSRLFHPDGSLAEEGNRRQGAWHGTVEVWHPGGEQAEEATYAYGICLEQVCWDEAGEVIEHFQLDVDSEMMALVERCRADDPDDGTPEAGSGAP